MAKPACEDTLSDLRIEFARSNRDYASDYIKFADTKAAAVLAFATTVVGVIVAAANAALTTSIGTSYKVLLTAAATPAILSFVWIAHLALVALTARATLASKSLASFPDTALMSEEALMRDLQGLGESEIVGHYAKHTHTLSSIAVAKFRSINEAIWWTRLLLVFSLFFAIVFMAVSADPRSTDPDSTENAHRSSELEQDLKQAHASAPSPLE
ncbi:MAG: hypothetical protein QM778_23490 [Myxococcales bacterium]